MITLVIILVSAWLVVTGLRVVFAIINGIGDAMLRARLRRERAK